MKKQLLSLVLTLALALSLLPVSAHAFAYYGAVYDATDHLGTDLVRTMGEETLPGLTERFGVDLKVDIVNKLEGYEIAEYAETFYRNYEYGYGDNKDGILLMVYVTQDDDGLAWGDYYLYGVGKGYTCLENYGNDLCSALDDYLNEDAWSWELETDQVSFDYALTYYAQKLETAMDDLGFADDLMEPQPITGEEDAGENSRSTAAEILSGIEQTGEAEEPSEPEVVAIEPEESGAAEIVPVQPEQTVTEPEQEQYVYDLTGRLSDREVERLERRASELSEQYECGVYIVMIPDYTDYGDSPYKAAKNIYTESEFGWGEEKSGELLMLSMADRDYSLIAYGYGNTAFTDYGKEKMEENFLDNFADDDWYGGFSDYLDSSETCLKMAREGTPLDVNTDPDRVDWFGIILRIVCIGVLPLAVAGIAVGSMVAKMKSVKIAQTATEYAAPGSLDLRVQEDVYTHTTVTRTHIERDRGGGGGTTVDSSGFSGHSGKF